MLLTDRALIYGDRAGSLNPNAGAGRHRGRRHAAQFGIEPRVALLSQGNT